MSTTTQVGSVLPLEIPSAAVARLLIVDDHPLFRMAIREILAHQPDLEVVADVGTAADAIECLSHQTFEVAIVDLLLPDGRGSSVVSYAQSAQPDCKVLALSGVEEPTQMAEMLRFGAHGFVLKSQTPTEIVAAVRAVRDGVRTVPDASRDQIDEILHSADAWRLDKLTPREREVFDFFVRGHSNEQIATELVISKRTVESHRQRIMLKLGTRSLGELLQLAIRHGVVPRRTGSMQ